MFSNHLLQIQQLAKLLVQQAATSIKQHDVQIAYRKG